MTIADRLTRGGAAALLIVALGACSSAGGLGNVLGTVLGGSAASQGDQVGGTVLGVDTRARQIGLQLSNGQQVGVSYDAQTRVVYENRDYAVTALERGDRVRMRIQQGGNAYYTDLVVVDRSVSDALGGSAPLQAIQGTVGQVDPSKGLFTLDVGRSARLLVALPPRLSRADVYRFRQLRQGDYVRLYGVFVTRSRVELREFY